MFKPIYRIVLDAECLVTRQSIRAETEVYGMKEARALINEYKSRQKDKISLLAMVYNQYDERVYDELHVTGYRRKVA
jgi:hypothetical protein